MSGCVLYAALAKCSWSVAKHKGIHRLTTVPLCRHLRNPFHLKVSALKSVPAYLIHSAIDLDFPCHIGGHKCRHRLRHVQTTEVRFD